MRTSILLARNLTWYWRTNLAVLLGVATTVAVFGGALLVGDSVRASLRDLVLARLGNADDVISRNGFFREGLASELGSACPIIAIDGVVVHEASGRRASGVQVYGVDERFWKFQAEPGQAPRGRQALLSEALTRELGNAAGDSILIRVEKPSAIPLESLHGRKENVGKVVRLTAMGAAFRDFSLKPQQGGIRSVFVPLAQLQRNLDQQGKVNTVLVATGLRSEDDIHRILKDRYKLEDLGLRLRVLEKQGCLSLESDSMLISDAVAERAAATASSLGLRTEPVLTYLANAIGAGGREIPYSVVTALDSAPAPAEVDGIALNQWAARDLEARPGDPVSLDYYVWKSDGRLHTQNARFRLVRVVPLDGAAADRDLAPKYPGITQTESLHDWDPPFPLDLGRVRPIDEQYWKRYRTTPKAFVALSRGRDLWGTRFGSLTSVRIFPPSEDYGRALRAALEPTQMGLMVFAVKAQGLQAAQGATDFGEYFTYFSFFLMVSALLLTGLFFKLGVEQRLREIGVLRALGFSISKIRSVFLLEGAALATAGALVGIAGALGYGELMMLGLRTWWVDAVNTKLLSLHASRASLAKGAVAGIIVSLGSIAWTLRGLEPAMPRGLLMGERKRSSGRRPVLIGIIAGAIALALLAASSLFGLNHTAGFFGAGTLLLVAALCVESAWLDSRAFASVRGQVSLGFRSAAYRPARSILCVALIASATFLIVSLDTFRRHGSSAGTGGFPLMAESVLPVIYDPNTPEGRDALNIPPLQGVEIVPFRLRPGDDTSCLNLYKPRDPRILAPPASFLRNARFRFRDSVAHKTNPWLQLESKTADGVIPVIADANSMTYALHLKLGQEFVLDNVAPAFKPAPAGPSLRSGQAPKVGATKFRVVAALEDSLFQGELLVSENNFLRLFPEVAGFRFFLLNVSPARAPEVTVVLENALSDYGFDVQPTETRLAGFHKVENTYLSTFRSLGALGLVLGTVGLGAILLRNVLERRRELALLRAVGYRPKHLVAIVLAENLLVLLLGVATGTVCALLAIVPEASLRGGHLPAVSLGLLLAAILATGTTASLAATAAALQSPLLTALRSE
jgi:ABC-type antimicrobial peptide transport system permease subunit